MVHGVKRRSSSFNTARIDNLIHDPHEEGISFHLHYGERGDGFADLSHVYDAAREIAAELQGFTVIVIKSTVPVGTNDEVDAIIRKLRPDPDFTVVSNPETSAC